MTFIGPMQYFIHIYINMDVSLLSTYLLSAKSSKKAAKSSKKAHSDSVPLSIFRGYIALPITLVDNNLTRVVLYSTYIYI